MLKIFPLDYYRLVNSKHVALMDFIASATEMFPIIQETFPRAVEMFREALENEHNAMRRTDRRSLNAEMRKADQERLGYFRVLRDMAKLKTRLFDKEIKEAAQTIVEACNAYGGSSIGSQSVDARTANIAALIQYLDDNCFGKVKALGLQQTLELLQEANQGYEEALSARVESDAAYGRRAVKRARKQCDFILKILFNQIQDSVCLGEGADFEEFVKCMNVEIDKYRISLGQGPGGRKPRRRKKEATNPAADDEIQTDLT